MLYIKFNIVIFVEKKEEFTSYFKKNTVMDRSRLFKIAHSIKNRWESFGESLRRAWKVVKLQMRLTKQTVSFRFCKVSGEIREAIGTLRADMLPESKGTGRAVNFGVLVYFDLSVEGGGAWRSAKVENLIF